MTVSMGDFKSPPMLPRIKHYPICQPTQERQRGVKALLATEGTLGPQRSLKLAWIMPSDKEEKNT